MLPALEGRSHLRSAKSFSKERLAVVGFMLLWGEGCVKDDNLVVSAVVRLAAGTTCVRQKGYQVEWEHPRRL